MKLVFAIVKRKKWYDLINFFLIFKAKCKQEVLIYIYRKKKKKRVIFWRI